MRKNCIQVLSRLSTMSRQTEYQNQLLHLTTVSVIQRVSKEFNGHVDIRLSSLVNQFWSRSYFIFLSGDGISFFFFSTRSKSPVFVRVVFQ